MGNSVVQDARWFPKWSTASTLTVTFYVRANKGVGAFSSFSAIGAGDIPALTIVFSGGHNDGVTIDLIRDSIISHFTNHSNGWWSPPDGIPVAEALRLAMSSDGWFPASGSSTNLNLVFDGQFGHVHVSV